MVRLDAQIQTNFRTPSCTHLFAYEEILTNVRSIYELIRWMRRLRSSDTTLAPLNSERIFKHIHIMNIYNNCAQKHMNVSQRMNETPIRKRIRKKQEFIQERKSNQFRSRLLIHANQFSTKRQNLLPQYDTKIIERMQGL